ncbi:MAG: holo-ACP synthase [bacterium]
MILGAGIDMVEVARLQRSLDRFGERLLGRLFHPSEISHCCQRLNQAECLAGVFATKEAFLKALGTGLAQGVSWLDMEVFREQGKPPHLRVRGRALEVVEELGGKSFLVSISHEAGLAVAMVLIQGSPRSFPDSRAELSRA